jgi:hypothetical protein
MKRPHSLFLAVAGLSLSSCVSFDPLQRLADEADREGGRAARRHDGSNPLDSAFQFAETLYYSKKYPGSPEQIQKAITRGRLAVSRWRERGETSGITEQGRLPARSDRKHEMPQYMVVSIGKSESTGQTQVAIFDTRVEGIVGKKILEVSTPPAQNATVKVEGVLAQFVGNGS